MMTSSPRSSRHCLSPNCLVACTSGPRVVPFAHCLMTQAVEGRNTSSSSGKSKQQVIGTAGILIRAVAARDRKNTNSHVPPVFRPRLRVAGAGRSNPRSPLQTKASRRARESRPSCAPWPCCSTRPPFFGHPKLGTCAAPPRALALSAGYSWPSSRSSRWCQFCSSSRASKNVSVRAFLSPVPCSSGIEQVERSTQQCMV